jgi:hypothetical protein
MFARLVRHSLAVVLVASFAIGATVAGASVGVHAILPPHNPSSNWNPGRIRSNLILPLVNDARRTQEGLGPLSFNLARYNKLAIPEQLFVIANLERVSRGETPIYGLWSELNSAAATGARLGRDPEPPPNWDSAFSSIWAGTPNSRSQAVFFADFGWMYEDGPPPYHGINNLDCTHRGAEGCWGHRDAILEKAPSVSFDDGSPVLLAGAAGGIGNYKGTTSLTMAFAWVDGVPKTGIVYTWARAVKFLGLPANFLPTTTTTSTTTTTTTTTTTAPVTGATPGG